MKCDKCGHTHAGIALGYICVGCPCEERPGADDTDLVTAILRSAASPRIRVLSRRITEAFLGERPRVVTMAMLTIAATMGELMGLTARDFLRLAEYAYDAAATAPKPPHKEN